MISEEKLEYMFYNKINNNKISNNRWIKFIDYIVGNNFKVKIEHISGQDNKMVDELSRLLLPNG